MRLGRKISEGYAVDHEADRLAAAQDRPEPAPAPRPELTEWSAATEEPARTGSRER
jgi:hypothetical protein